MAQQIINIGSGPNKGDGDQTRTAFTKINNNFTEVYGEIELLKEGPGTGDTLTQSIIGSVYAEDSSILVDAVNGEIPGYISIDRLKTEVAASTDFADFQARIALL